VRVLIVGCGYVGQIAGERLARLGHEVFGMQRSASGSPALRAAGIIPVVADVTRIEQMQKLPGPFDWVVNTVSSTRGGPEEYRAVYLEGTRNLIETLPSGGLRKYVYTSSTSVYGQSDGSIVDEQSPTEPAAETTRILLQTEALLLDAARTKNLPAVILRASGIYGPGRGHLFQQYLRNEAVNTGRLINMIHRDDLAGIIISALEKGRPAEIYNANDDEPVEQSDFFAWLSEKLQRPMPPSGSAEAISRKRGLTNKRVSNRKIKTELGCQLQYPTFREGYSAEIARLGLANPQSQ
jgi:nucleoside-diphosphate-sugar epimerase